MPTEGTSCCELESIAVQSGCQHHSPAKTKTYLAQEKLQRMAQDTKIATGLFEKMVKWVAYDTIGALLPIRMTNFSSTNVNTTKKISSLVLS